MNSAAIKGAGIVGFMIICAVCLLKKVPEIENDLNLRAAQQLQYAEIPAGVLVVNGRDAILSGTVGSEALMRRAEAAVAGVRGIRRVKNRLQVVPPPPADKAAAADSAGIGPPEDAPPAAEVQPSGEERLNIQNRLDSLMAESVIEFTPGRSELSSKSYPLMMQIAEVLKLKPGAVIEIAGHTDATGSRRLNRALSQRRADSIRRYLQQQGIDGKRLKAVGYGSERPIASNKTREGRRKNRRVEFIVLEEN